MRRGDATEYGGIAPGCDLRAATRAGTVLFDAADTYRAAGDRPVTRCYDGVLVRYTADGRTVTVVGSSGFLTNAGLPEEGNAALAMNLAGSHPRAIWYAPQHSEGTATSGDAELSDLVPAQVGWLILQLVVAVILLAVWKARRVGPLVAEQLPVDRAGIGDRRGPRPALPVPPRPGPRRRRAAHHRRDSGCCPGSGWVPAAAPAAVAAAVAQRCGLDPQAVAHTLYGPPPADDGELVSLARRLDDIERQVAQS